jgi:hypothetical protein
VVIGPPVRAAAHVRYGRRDTDGPAARVGHLLPDLDIDIVPELLPRIADIVVLRPVDDGTDLDRHHDLPAGTVYIAELDIQVDAPLRLARFGLDHR